ncbi:MAG: DNA methylase N-4, partial [Sphingomonadales bacterium]
MAIHAPITGGDLQVIHRPIGSLTPYARNPRTHSKKQIKQIAAAITEFGWTNPILLDGDGGIIA